MNVFEKYLKEIKEVILKNLKKLNIKDFDNFEGVMRFGVVEAVFMHVLDALETC